MPKLLAHRWRTPEAADEVNGAVPAAPIVPAEEVAWAKMASKSALSVWTGVEERLSKMPSTDPARRRFQRWTSLYGQSSEIDGQGRVLIHPLLRERAAMQGDVFVLGQTQFLEIWNSERFMADSDAQRLTDDDYRRLSEFGI